MLNPSLPPTSMGSGNGERYRWACGAMFGFCWRSCSSSCRVLVGVLAGPGVVDQAAADPRAHAERGSGRHHRPADVAEVAPEDGLRRRSTASPDLGWHFVDWRGRRHRLDRRGDELHHGQFTADHTIDRQLRPRHVHDHAHAGAGGTISPAIGAQTVELSVARPDLHASRRRRLPRRRRGRRRHARSAPMTSHTFSDVQANHTISATFAINTFTMTPTAVTNGSISPATAQTVNYGGSRPSPTPPRPTTTSPGCCSTAAR